MYVIEQKTETSNGWESLDSYVYNYICTFSNQYVCKEFTVCSKDMRAPGVIGLTQ